MVKAHTVEPIVTLFEAAKNWAESHKTFPFDQVACGAVVSSRCDDRFASTDPGTEVSSSGPNSDL